MKNREKFKAGLRLPSNRIQPIVGLWLLMVIIFWLMLLTTIPDFPDLLYRYGHFFVIGLLGAIVANSTGAGGGIIFIPFFTVLGLEGSQSLATSLVIQCFGMTAGSFSWLSRRAVISTFPVQRKLLRHLLLVGGVPTICGVLLAQYYIAQPDWPIVHIFRVFSVVFGAALLVFLYVNTRRKHTRYHVSIPDACMIIVVCLAGGMMTAWISIGVGEWVVLALIFRNYPTMVAVATGVCMSAISVLTAAPLHYLENTNIEWHVVLFAAPAAIIGGSVARILAYWLGANRLKTLFAVWILVAGFLI